MTTEISESARRAVAQTLPLLEQHQDTLVAAMAASLAATESRDEPSDQADVAAATLVELLLRQGRSLGETGRANGLDGLIERHRALDVDGRHYSRFGDALVAILGDTLGPSLPRPAASAWCDAFWGLVRAMHARETVRA